MATAVAGRARRAKGLVVVLAAGAALCAAASDARAQVGPPTSRPRVDWAPPAAQGAAPATPAPAASPAPTTSAATPPPPDPAATLAPLPQATPGAPATSAAPPAPGSPAPPNTPWIELRTEGKTLRVQAGAASAVLDLGCEGRKTLRFGEHAFVACGPDGVVEVDISNPLAPKRLGVMPVDGEATALFVRDGRVWTEIAHYFARPVRTDGVVEVRWKTPSPAGAPSAEEPSSESPSPAQHEPHWSQLAPPRDGGTWELSALAGAFVNLGPSSGGLTAWLDAVYRFEAPIVVRLELAPLGFGFGNSVMTQTTGVGNGNPGGSIAVGSLQALVGVDTQFLELAVGGGASTLGDTQANTANGAPSTGGASVVAAARFGAHDGLAFNFEGVVVGANSAFRLATVVTSLQIPLSRTVMLIARGGGGNMGVLYGDLGARVVVAGEGGRGTVALTGFFGGAGIDFQGCNSAFSGVAITCPYASLGGPSVGGGIEWRR